LGILKEDNLLEKVKKEHIDGIGSDFNFAAFPALYLFKVRDHHVHCGFGGRDEHLFDGLPPCFEGNICGSDFIMKFKGHLSCLAVPQHLLYFRAAHVKIAADEDQFRPVNLEFLKIGPPCHVIEKAAPIFETNKAFGANQLHWKFAYESLEFCALEGLIARPGKRTELFPGG